MCSDLVMTRGSQVDTFDVSLITRISTQLRYRYFSYLLSVGRPSLDLADWALMLPKVSKNKWQGSSISNLNSIFLPVFFFTRSARVTNGFWGSAIASVTFSTHVEGLTTSLKIFRSVIENSVEVDQPLTKFSTSAFIITTKNKFEQDPVLARFYAKLVVIDCFTKTGMCDTVSQSCPCQHFEKFLPYPTSLWFSKLDKTVPCTQVVRRNLYLKPSFPLRSQLSLPWQLGYQKKTFRGDSRRPHRRELLRHNGDVFITTISFYKERKPPKKDV